MLKPPATFESFESTSASALLQHAARLRLGSSGSSDREGGHGAEVASSAVIAVKASDGHGRGLPEGLLDQCPGCPMGNLHHRGGDFGDMTNAEGAVMSSFVVYFLFNLLN